MSKLSIATLLFWALISTSTYADWELDNANSTLTFVSTKKSSISEVNTFEKLSGQLDASGQFKLKIDLSSVETNISIRNQRMQEFLFETKLTPLATVSGKLDPSTVSNLKVGTNTIVEVQFTLDLHGEKATIDAELNIVKLSENKVLVVSNQPIIINANAFALSKGIAKLQELAGLPSINSSIPVSFTLMFNL